MITNTAFRGMRPIVEPLNLHNDNAIYCSDCYLHSSGVDPLRGGKYVKKVCTESETIYRIGEKIVCMSDWTDFVRSPNMRDKYNRIYYTQNENTGLFVTDCDSLVDNVSGASLSDLKPPIDAPIPVITRCDTMAQGYIAYSWVDEDGGDIGLSSKSDQFEYADGDDSVSVKVSATTRDDVVNINIYYVDMNGDYYLQRTVPASTSRVSLDPFTADMSNAINSTGATIAEITDPLVSVIRDTTHLKTTSFLVTYVSIRDEETTNSPISISVDYEDGCDCLNLGLPSTNNLDIAYMRIYMDVEGSYFLLREVSATLDSIDICPLDDDFVTTGQNDPESIIGNEFSTGNYDPPPEDIIGLRGLPNGSLAGFSNNDGDGCDGATGVVYISVPYQPHAFPVDYRFPIRSKIVALRNVPEGLLVLTEGKPSLITGSTPDVMDEHELETQHSCRDHRSALEIGESVIWSSPDGVAIYGGRSVRIISKDVWSREQWQELDPDNMLFGFYEGRVIIYCLEKQQAYIYNLSRNDIISLSEYDVHALLYDTEDDALFVARGGDLERFNEGDVLEAEWVSKPHIVPAARVYNSMRISPEGETHISLYKGDNRLGHADYLSIPFWEFDKSDQEVFRVRSSGRAREICIGFRLTGGKRLRLFELSNDMRELV